MRWTEQLPTVSRGTPYTSSAAAPFRTSVAATAAVLKGRRSNAGREIACFTREAVETAVLVLYSIPRIYVIDMCYATRTYYVGF